MRFAVGFSITILCIASVGCGSSTIGGSSTQQTPQTINVAGSWQITAKSNTFVLTTAASGSLIQSGNTLSGQLSISGSPCASSAPLNGTLSGSNLNLSINEGGQIVTLSGTVTADGNSASGTYTAPTGGCTNGDSGTWTGTRTSAPISSITISPTTAILDYGGTLQFTATVNNLNSTLVNWEVDGTLGGNTSVGTIDANGLYTAPTLAGNSIATITAVAQAQPSVTASANITLVVPASPILAAISLNPTDVTGGSTSTGTVVLAAPASAGGAVVTLTSSAPNIASVPHTITVQAGSSTTTFVVTTTSSAAATFVTITAQLGLTRTVTIHVHPVLPALADLTGNWQAAFTSSISAVNSGALYGYLSQSGNSVTADLHIQGASNLSCFSNASLTGVVSASRIQFAATNGGQVATFTGTINTNGNEMQGSYSVSGGCTGGDSGTWTATKIQSGQCVPAPTGLLSWWRGEANTSDAMGLNPGTAVSGVSYLAGVVGQAFSFDGLTRYVNVQDSPSLDSIKNTESVEMWINPTTPNGAEYIYARRQPITAESFSIFILDDGTLGVLIGTTTSPTPTGSKYQSGTGAITFGQFQHVAVTASTATGSVRAYINGTEVALTNTFGPQTLTGTFNAVNQLYLGRREDLSVGEGVSGAGYTKGLVDEVTLYAAELDAAQVEFLFHGGSGGKCPAAQTISSLTQGVLDQSFTASSSAGSVSAYINESFTYVSQTFTTGVSGYLTGVNIDVLSQPTNSLQTSPFPIIVSILATSNGIPTATVLASAVVGPGNVGLGSLVSFEQPANVVAGTQYAIAVSYVGAPPVGAGEGQGLWIGAQGKGYAGGSMFASVDGTHWSDFNSFNLFFRTYVAQ